MAPPVEGGYYAYRVRPKLLKRLFRKGDAPERAYRVVKVWRLDEVGAWLAVFGDLFDSPPIPLDPSRLTTYFATFPVPYRSFDRLRAKCIFVGEVEAAETEGWALAQGEPGGFGYVTVSPDEFMLTMLEQGFTFPELKWRD